MERKLTGSEIRIAVWHGNDGNTVGVIVIEPSQQVVRRDPPINAFLLTRYHLHVGIREQKFVLRPHKPPNILQDGSLTSGILIYYHSSLIDLLSFIIY